VIEAKAEEEVEALGTLHYQTMEAKPRIGTTMLHDLLSSSSWPPLTRRQSVDDSDSVWFWYTTVRITCFLLPLDTFGPVISITRTMRQKHHHLKYTLSSNSPPLLPFSCDDANVANGIARSHHQVHALLRPPVAASGLGHRRTHARQEEVEEGSEAHGVPRRKKTTSWP
jgi:hypothetical protein